MQREIRTIKEYVVCDDTEREYGSDEKAAEFYDVVEKENWTAFSMANDWKIIYAGDVKKTELPGAEDTIITPEQAMTETVEEAPEAEEAEEAAQSAA